MHNFIPSKVSLELFQLEALTILNLSNSIVEKLENTPGLCKDELSFWIERLKVLNDVAENDSDFLKVSKQLEKQALLN